MQFEVISRKKSLESVPKKKCGVEGTVALRNKRLQQIANEAQSVELYLKNHLGVQEAQRPLVERTTGMAERKFDIVDVTCY